MNESSSLSVAGDLNIESDATATGSLINNGTLTVSGTASSERYMTGNAWHVISPTFTGGSISDFIQNAGNAIPGKLVGETTSYGMMDYVESTNVWDSYYQESTLETLEKGKGYSVRRTSDGVVTFTGTINSGNQSVAITASGEGWNCIGNPYPSAIMMNDAADAANNFLRVNAITNLNLDGSYACVYVWDQASSTYKILGNTDYGGRNLGQNYLQSGQGFFVKSKTGGATISFTPAMQTHQPATTFKSAEVQWPGFELMATINGNTSSASITFNENMTTGLDVTYDAGLLRGSNGVNIYTRLVEDNGVDFAIQCLPDEFESLVIPLGIESSKSGDLVLSSALKDIPEGWIIMLEDRQEETMTKIDESLSLEIQVEEGMKSNGRFYIHINNEEEEEEVVEEEEEEESGETTSSKEKSISDIKAYFFDGFIYLSGEVRSGSTLGIYDIGGRNLGEHKLSEGRLNSIPASDLRSGIYLLRVNDGDNLIMKKVVVKQ